MRRLLFLPLALILLSCGGGKTAENTLAKDFDQITQDFIYGTLALSPVAATANGYHTHQGLPLDELIDDYSEGGLQAQRKAIDGFKERLAAFDPAKLDKEQKADLGIIKNNIELTLLELNTIQSYKHNPTVYVELVGNALYTPYMLNYAPVEQRFRQINRRLEKVPALIGQAMANLEDSPEVWNRVAQEENQGNIELINKTLLDAAPVSLKQAYSISAELATDSLKEFNAFLKDKLSKKTSDWRLGKEKYASKFKLVLGIPKTPEQLLADAEADLKKTREEMVKLAAPMTVEQALNAVAAKHATPDTYMEKARQTLEQATAFVREKDLVTLPARANLKVVETPEFLRGIYGVGGFNAAPALEPQLGAFYWVTPIPKTWSRERAESKLREYNDYGMQQLTIHEAMPGHWVQLEYANDVDPLARRLLRNIFASGPYVEGWAVYTQQLMDEAGYLNGSKELRLTFYKQLLRVLANTILDVRLQTMDMKDQEALDLMMKQTYQEKEEATAKLQRAQLSSCQLPTYYAGLNGWREVREKYKQRKGAAFSLKEFHERALKESGVPLAVLDDLLQ